MATHRAVVEGRPIARGAVGVAADALVLLLAGKVAVGTVIHARPLQEEVVQLTLWLGGGKATNHNDACVECFFLVKVGNLNSLHNNLQVFFFLMKRIMRL